MKPERIQSKEMPNELWERIEILLQNHPEWVLRSDDAVLVRRWQMPDRRAATSLMVWLSHLAQAIGAEPELTLRQHRVTLKIPVSDTEAQSSYLDLIPAVEGVAD